MTKRARYEDAPNALAGVLYACCFWGFLLLFWIVAGELDYLNPAMLPTVQKVGKGFWDLMFPPAHEQLFNAKQVFRYYGFLYSCAETAMRMAIAAGIGIPAGLFLATMASVSTRLRSILFSSVWIFKVVPKYLLLIPLAMFGIFGSPGAITAGVLASSTITFMMMYPSLNSEELQDYIDEGRSLGVSRATMMVMIVLPSPGPVMAFSNTLIVAIEAASTGVGIAELFVTTTGLGTLFKVAFTNGALPELLSIALCSVMLVLTGVVLGVLYRLLSDHIWAGIHALYWTVFYPSRCTN